eukprot:CAMPEP_0117468992 /NCGR_PEP_ID=MMETSP0784-20121206/6463_1 /TAXON_ID=39447 /ORGANISM="" /LENGTH=547 /DNA_ID=CAMNT_0005263021 /DNA_START=9 /DNA_END=1649 /DNA_ORIENTATION=-
MGCQPQKAAPPAVSEEAQEKPWAAAAPQSAQLTAAKSSENRALSVEYLRSEFFPEVFAAGWTRSAKVYEIEPLIRKKGESCECPRDSEVGCAYVDAVSDDSAGIATAMLSYTWGYGIGDIVDALVQHCAHEQLAPDATYIWMCCFCINQHRVRARQAAGKVVPFDDFKAAFGSRVQSIGVVLALMAPWEQPTYLTRVWCIYEMATAIELGRNVCRVHILMPTEEKKRLTTALIDLTKSSRQGENERTGPARIFDALANVRVQDGQASVPGDRDSILQLIAGGIGHEAVNREVASYLKSWFASTLRSSATAATAVLPSERSADLCAMVCVFLRETGDFSAGIAFAAHILGVVRPDTSDEATVLRALGAFHMKRASGDDLDQASRLYERAHELFVAHKPGYREDEDYAKTCNARGAIARKMGDLSKAERCFNEGKLFYDSTPDLNTGQKSMLLGNVGHVRSLRGDLAGAGEAYEAALQCRRALDMWVNPDTALVLNSVGELKKKQADITGARATFAEAVAIREKTATLSTPAGELLLRNHTDSLAVAAA